MLFAAGPVDLSLTGVESGRDTVTADGVDAALVTVRVRDGQGNAVAGALVELEMSGSGNDVTQPVGLTGPDGIATGAVRSTVAEAKTVRARVDGALALETAEVLFAAGQPDRFVITHDGAAVAGVPENVGVEVRDAFDNTVSWFADEIRLYTDSTEPLDMITWGIGTGTGTITAESGDTLFYRFAPTDLGAVTFLFTDTRAETVRFSAAYGAVLSTSAEAMTVQHGAADSIFILSGDRQRGVVGTPVALPLTVAVVDAWGNRVGGETVTFVVTAGGGAIDTDPEVPGPQATAVTDLSGTAVCASWILGTTSGEDSDRVEASIASGKTTSVVFTATTDHDEPAAVVLTPLSGSVTVGSATVVTAAISDQYGNSVVGENITIFIKDTADGNLAADPSNPNPTSSLGPTARWGASDSSGTITVRYNAPATAGLQDVIDADHATVRAEMIDDVIYTSVASGATKLIVADLAGLPAQAGTPFTFSVRAVDSNDNLDPGNSSRITLAPQAGGGLEFSIEADFSELVTEADLAGGAIALFGRGSAAGTWRTDITAADPVLSATHFNASITANNTVHHYLIGTPPSAVAGESFTLSVRAEDAWGNLVTSAGYDVDLRAVQPQDTTLDASSALSITGGTIVGGVLNEKNMRYETSESIRIEVSDDSTSVVGVGPITLVQHAAAYQIVALGGDTTGVAAGDSVLIRVRVLDRFGNAVEGETVSFSILEGGGGLAASQRLTAGDGSARVALRTGFAAGTNRVRATILDGNPQHLETREFVIETVPGSAIASVVLEIQGSVFEAGQAIECHAAAYDQYDNLITSDYTTRLVPVAESFSVEFVPDTLQLSAGQASFTARDTLAGTNRIAIESLAGELIAPYSAPLTINPAAAWRIAKLGGDTTGVISGAAVTLTARVEDRFGNAKAGEIVRFLITSALGGAPALIDDHGAPDDGITISLSGGNAVCTLVTDTNAGLNTVAATILDGDPPDLERVVFEVGTSAGLISRYELVPDGLTREAGEAFALSLTAYDLNDNIASGDDTTVVSLGSDGTAVIVPNPVTLSGGRAEVSVTETAAGALTVWAETQGGGALSYSPPVTIVPGPPSGVIGIASVVPDTITADGSSRTLITTEAITDTHGNTVARRTRVTVTASGGTITSDDLDPDLPGVQRETGISGAVSVFLQSSAVPGDVAVQFESVEGDAAGTAAVVFAPPPEISFAGYQSPHYIVPGSPAAFRIRVENASPTGVVLAGASSLSLRDGSGEVYLATLGSAVTIAGGETDTLVFQEAVVPAGFDPGTYTPRVSLQGSDRFGAAYNVEFDTGTNSVIVSSIEVAGITPYKTVLSRGDTVRVDVAVRNRGGEHVIVQEIQLEFARGSYSILGPAVPHLPDTLMAGLQRVYAIDVRVLPGSPLGADTVDAAVRATVNGNDIYDYSADDRFAVWLIQSAALIDYVGGTLAPAAVSRGQEHAFSVRLSNAGQAPVILDAVQTRLSFNDGVRIYTAALGSEGALPGQTSTTLAFPPAHVPADMSAGMYPVTLELRGTENGGHFDTTLVIADPVRVDDPADLEYIASSLSPLIVSRSSTVAFEAGIRNTGGAAVVCDPAETRLTITDGTTVYTALLDGTRGATLDPGDNTIWFRSVAVPPQLPVGVYTPDIHIGGLENEIFFAADVTVDDGVTVQDPPQLAITSISVLPSDLFTADQDQPRVARVRLANNGGATVRLDSLETRFFLAGNNVTHQYNLTQIDFTPGKEIAGGVFDSIHVLIEDAPGPMSTGTVVIEASIWGIDLNSSLPLAATTEYGGKGSFLVQTPAVVGVTKVIASTGSATSGQTRDWSVDVVVRNTGQSDAQIDLYPADTYLEFSTSDDFSVISPSELAAGGTILAGGATDTLSFIIDQTGTASGTCRVNAVVAALEINSGRVLPPAGAAYSDQAVVEIEAPAVLEITSITPSQNPVTLGQARVWTIDVALRNNGGSSLTLDAEDVDSTLAWIEGGSGFAFSRPEQLVEGGLSLPAAASGTLRFTVDVTGDAAPGETALAARVIATEDNSARRVFDEASGPVGVNSLRFDLRPDPRYEAGSLSPTVASSGTGIELRLDIASDDPAHATLLLDRAATEAWFGDADGDTFRTNLSPISPAGLAGGGEATLIFNSRILDEAIERTSYTVGIRLAGLENGNPFSAQLTTVPDLLTVEEAPQLSIVAIETPPSVTRTLQPPWDVRMILHNTGEASVALDLDQAHTNISFSIAGVGDCTGEYEIVQPTGLAGSGGVVLAGNQVDTLVFSIAGTGSTTGIALVNGRVAADDMNSGERITDDTFTGGGRYLAVQAPAAPVILETAAARDTITSGQAAAWSVALHVRNDGEAAMTFDADGTGIFGADTLFVEHPPQAFRTGGVTLAAGESGYLDFEIAPSPQVESDTDIRIDALAAFIENNRGAPVSYDTRISGAGFGAVHVQTPPRLRIVSLSAGAPRAPYVDRGQVFPLLIEVENSGGAAASQAVIDLSCDGHSIVIDAPLVIGRIAGGGVAAGQFTAEAGDISGEETFTAALVSALDANSGQSDLVVLDPAVDSSATITIQVPGALAVTSVIPSQSALNAGQTADWTLRIELVNHGEGPVSIEAPAAADIVFRLAGALLSDYLVVAPGGLVSGGLSIPGAAADSLHYVVSTTGSDTGMVEVSASVRWRGDNDPAPAASVSSADAVVHVREPSGLRIISVSSNAPNNATFPNTSIVNVGQTFQVAVTVENTGGDDLREVEVELVSNGAAGIEQIASSADLPSGSSGEFVYDVQSGVAGVEVLTAAIVRAVSVNTGQEVPPIQALESIENLRVEIQATLVISAEVTAPPGALNDTLSAAQEFDFSALVTNTGQAAVDATGQVSLQLPDGFEIVNPQLDSLTRVFGAGERVSWAVRAPAAATPAPQGLVARISRAPRDVNIASAAFVQTPAAQVDVVIEEAASAHGCALAVESPGGAVDGVLSTGQPLVVRADVTPSANSVQNTATLAVPAGFALAGEATAVLGDGDGSARTARWTVTAPENVTSSVDFTLATSGIDGNSGLAFSGCGAQMNVTVVERAVLDLAAYISGPPEAVEGKLSPNLAFTIRAEVSNLGTAGVDTAGARIEIVLPAGAGYELDGEAETFRKPYAPGAPVEWRLRAPLASSPPRIITVRFVQPAARDENTSAPAAVATAEVPIGVTTEAGTIAMQNISRSGEIPPYVVPQGAPDVPVLRVVFRNNSDYTAGLDTLYVSVKDGDGRLHANPARYVSTVTLAAGGVAYSAAAGDENPIPLVAGHAFSIEPGAADTALVSIDVARGAPAGQLRIDLARSDDVVFSIGADPDRSRIRVVWDASGGDIAGRFYNTPLSVMSAVFEEYVHNYPNPFRAGSQSTKIAYFLTQNAQVRVRIFDFTGVLVWAKEIPAGAPGGRGEPEGTWWEIEWDGRNGAGEVVRNGVYVCMLEAGGRSAVFKIAVAK